MIQDDARTFIQQDLEPELTEQQEKVFQVIKKHGPITLKGVARRMNKFPNEISGRVTELRNSHRVIEVKQKTSNGNMYSVVDELK